MPMYLETARLAAPRDLNQGDILRSVPWPDVPHGENLVRFPNLKCHDHPAKPTDFREPQKLRVKVKVTFVDGLVCSNSCDIGDDTRPIYIAPIDRFLFNSQATNDALRWS